MKKNIIVIFCVISALLGSFFLGFFTKDIFVKSQIDNQSQTINVIDKDEEICINNAISTADTITCVRQSSKEWRTKSQNIIIC